MADTTDAATARALLEAKREGYVHAVMKHCSWAKDYADRSALRNYPDPAPPTPKRLARRNPVPNRPRTRANSARIDNQSTTALLGRGCQERRQSA